MSETVDGVDTKEGNVTKTVVCEMETSKRKNSILRPFIDQWQEMASHMADLMPSYKESQWGTKVRKDQRIKRDFPDVDMYAAIRNEAAYKVCESFDSWQSNGKMGDSPSFGEGNYIRIRTDYVDIGDSGEEYAVHIGLSSNEDIWWGLKTGKYQTEILDRITNSESDVSGGSAEVHLHEDGSLTLHQNYTKSVEIYRKPDLNRWLGVDLGESKMWVASPVEDDEPIGAATFDQYSGEFRENRERLSCEGDRLQRRGELSEQRLRRERRNYTDTMTHTASCEIADLALEYEPCGIALEDLTGYRKSAEDPIHDWPYNQLQEKIKYKANEKGIPVREVNPAGSSVECWKCGTEEYAERKDRQWLVCDGCGDRRHADVNAAINIGMRAVNQ